MKVLSVKIELANDFSDEIMKSVIIQWLKSDSKFESIGKQYENINDIKANLEDNYCKIDAYKMYKNDENFTLFKFEHIYYKQIWISEIILKHCNDGKVLYIHIKNKGDMQYEKVPLMRTDIIRAFVNSSYIKKCEIPITSEPIYITDEIIDVITKVVNGDNEYQIPIVFVSKIFNCAGYEVDIDNLAKSLAGMAFVVAENECQSLRDKTDKKIPFNGYIAIYYPGKDKSKILSPSCNFKSRTLDNIIINEVTQYLMTQVDIDATTWDNLYVEYMADDIKIKNKLLEEAEEEKNCLEGKLKNEQNRRFNMSSRIEILEHHKNTSTSILNMANIKEFYDYEQHDLIVTILNNALQNYKKDTRAYELLTELIKANPIKGYGKDIFEKIKKIFSCGEAINEKELKELKKIGFIVVSEKNHYKITFKGNEKYLYSISKTPSDVRAGKNLISNIVKSLSIYK